MKAVLTVLELQTFSNIAPLFLKQLKQKKINIEYLQIKSQLIVIIIVVVAAVIIIIVIVIIIV